MRKYLLINVILVIFLFAGCQKKYPLSDLTASEAESVLIAEQDIDRRSLEECVQSATHVLEGVYTGCTQDEYVPQLMFRITADYKGNYQSDGDDTIFVSVSSAEETEKYDENESYCLVLEKHNWVFYEHPQYVSLVDPPLRITEDNREKLKQSIEKYLASSDHDVPESYGMPFAESDNINDVLKVTKDVFYAEIVEETDRSDYGPTCVMRCAVEKVLAGNHPAERDILITFPVDTVQPGTKQILLLSGPADEGSVVYVLASRHSFYSLDEALAIEELSPYIAALSEEAGTGHNVQN